MTVPEGWKLATLGSISISKPEYGANVAKSDFNPDWPRYIRITDINSHGRLNSDFVSIKPKDADQYILSRGDFLLARSGATVGKSYLYKKVDGLCAFAGYLIRFRIDEYKAEPEYIAQYFLSQPFWGWVSRIAREGAQPNINAREYSSIKMILPPLPEQKKIAEILSSVDEAIQATRETIEQTKRVKKGLLQELLTRGIGHTQFKQTEIGEIPEEWEVSRLECVSTRSSGTTPNRGQTRYYTKSEGYAWVKTLDLNDRLITLTDERVTESALKENNLVLNPPGTVMVAMYGGFKQIGRSGILGIFAATNQAICSIHLHNSVLPIFCNFWLVGRRYLWRWFAASSRKDPNITKNDVGGFPIVIPPLPEQEKIAEILSSVDERIQSEQTKMKELEQVKRGLMQDLLTGKVRV